MPYFTVMLKLKWDLYNPLMRQKTGDGREQREQKENKDKEN